MSGVNRKHKKIFKFKKVFSLILISYGLMLLIPIVLSGYLIFMVNSLTAARYRENIAANLEQSCLLMEQRIEAMDKNARTLMNHSLLSQIVRFPRFRAGDKNVIQILEFQKHLKTLFPEDMKQYAVILKNGYVFTYSGVSFGREFFFDSARTYENMEYDEWIDRSFYLKERSLFPFQSVKQGGGTRKGITYSMPVGSYSMPDEADGCVQILISEEFLRDIFQPILRLQDCYVVLYADNGGKYEPVLRMSDYDACGYSEDFPVYEELDICEMDGVRAISGDEKVEFGEIIYHVSQNGKFSAVVYMPQKLITEETRHIRVTLLCLLGICLVIEIGLGIYFSYRYSTPIKNMIHNIHTILQPSGISLTDSKRHAAGEYDQLETGVNMIIQKNHELKTELIKKETREVSNFYKRLLNGMFNREEEALAQLKELNLSFEAKGYCVAVIKAGDTSEKFKDFSLADWGSQRYRVQVMEGGMTAIIFAVDEEEAQRFYEKVSILDDRIKMAAGKGIPSGIGRIYHHLTDITFSYNQALYCIKIAQERNTEKMVIYEEAAQNQNLFYYPAELEERLINSTRHGESEQIEKIFGQILDENVVKRHLPPAMERLLGANIIATLLKVYSDTAPEEKLDSLLNKRHDNPDLSMMLTEQKQMFLDICSELVKNRSEKQEDIRRQFQDFMEENYQDSQLSVRMMADKFEFSESYFSIIFKEAMGESFSVYLEKVRIGHAKQLLEEGLGVEAVSGRVGYNNSGTFRRAFKRATGISPSEWLGK